MNHSFIRESVLWDISKGRIEHAEETLRIAAKMNEVTFKEPILQNHNQIIDSKENKSFIKNINSEKLKTNVNFKNVLSNATIIFYLLSVTFLWSEVSTIKLKKIPFVSFDNKFFCYYLRLTYNSMYYNLVLTTDIIKRDRWVEIINIFVNSFYT